MRPNRTKRECPHRGGKGDGYDNPEVGSAIRKKGQDEKDDDFRKQDSRIRMAHDPPKPREVQSSRSPNAEHEHEKGGRVAKIGACWGGQDLHPKKDNIPGHRVGKDSAVPHKRKTI